VTVGELCTRLNDENMCNLIVMFIRLVTSAEIQRRADFFMPFVSGVTETFMDTEGFCRRHVECMGEESDHVQLVAVADAFQVCSVPSSFQ
jgi:ubiquitin thioesterase protein OTUB1